MVTFLYVCDTLSLGAYVLRISTVVDQLVRDLHNDPLEVLRISTVVDLN